jgi:predicted MFS family arabinose efflux permease
LHDLDISSASSPALEAELETKPISPPSKRPRPPFRYIWTPATLAVLLSFGLLPFHNAAFMHILPVYLSTPISPNEHATLFTFSGGLGLHSPSIGLYLSLFGIGGILLQMFIYPRIQAKIGTLGVFRIALFMFPVTYALAPYLSLLPQEGWVKWPAMGIIIWSQIMARTLAIPSTVILLTNSVEQKSVLGTVHGAGNMLSSLARAVGPAVGGWIFGWGLDHGVVGASWWFWLLLVALAALAASYLMKREEQD